MKKISVLLTLMLLFIPVSVFATETINEEVIVDEITDEDALKEEEESNEVENYVTSKDLNSKITVNPIIVDDTNPMIETIVIDVYNIDSQEIKYLELDKTNNYIGEISLKSGSYNLKVRTDSAADVIELLKTKVELNNNNVTVDLYIEGLTDEELEAWNNTSLKGESDALIEQENVNNDMSEPNVEEEKGSAFLDFLLNNLFFILILIILLFSYVKIKKNKYK